MFKQLELKNFRQHKDLTVNFENGVVALRGANESGKTTLLEAISYAMGGARMLREPLVDVVTWGMKDSQLKVRLVYEVNGTDYAVSRGKSGAEIKCGDEIKATGQDEVTRYIETLIGCPIKTATSLMLANQQKLRGTLEEDGAAIKLIEQLANFAMIDQIIGLVQQHRPCGATTTIKARIANLEPQLAVPVEDPTPPYRDAIQQHEVFARNAQDEYDVTRMDWEKAQEPARDAQQRLDQAKAATQALERARNDLESAKVALAAIRPVEGPPQAEIEAMRKQVADATLASRATQAWNALKAVPAPVWEGSHEKLVESHDQVVAKHRELSNQIADCGARIREARARKITETACGLCGKDLSAVPEVVAKNSKLDAEIAQLEALSLAAAEEIGDIEDEALQYKGAINDGAAADRVFARCAEFIELDHGFTPAKWTWTGPDVTKPVQNPTLELQQAELKVSRYQQDLGRQQQQQALVDRLQTAVGEAAANETAKLAAVQGAQAVLDAAAVVTATLFEQEQKLNQAKQQLHDAEVALSSQQMLYDHALQQRRGLEKQLADAKRELAEMVFNNELIAALRDARPRIVEDLWNIVGGTVSDYFSQIRGVASVFERQDDSFRIDGRGIKGYSGSTLDGLGLAIRMALTKTFLPNTRFLVLDEPAAAADEARETNMLGLIAASQFDQVLLVTHSDLADSFASQVVQL